MIQMDVEHLKALAHEQMASYGVSVTDLVGAIRACVGETDRSSRIPDSFWTRVNVAGLNRMLLPGSFGGSGNPMSALARVAVFEDVGCADPGYAIALPGPGLATPPVTSLGNREQQGRFFASFRTDQPVWAAFAITEPDVGSDATSIRTTATRTERGYVLNGTKCFITNGARASTIVVFASADRTRGRFGVRAFLVDRNAPGFSVVRTERMLGMRASQLAVLSFDDCEVPAENMLCGPEGRRVIDAFSAAQGAWDFMRPMLTSIIVGTCRRIRTSFYERVEGHGLGTRDANGSTVRGVLREMDRLIATSRLLALKAAWKYDHGLAMSKDASMAKAYASRAAMQMAEQALAVLGLDGLCGTPDLERAYRDVKGFDILEGTGDMQRLMTSAAHSRESVDFARLANPY